MHVMRFSEANDLWAKHVGDGREQDEVMGDLVYIPTQKVVPPRAKYVSDRALG